MQMKKTYIMRTLTIAFSIALLNCHLIYALNLKLLKDFLIENHLRILSILSCDGPVEDFKIVREIQKQGVWTNAYDISSGMDGFNLSKIFSHENNPMGVVIDLTCNRTMTVLNAMSTNNLFNMNYVWLMLASDFSRAFSLLENQNINLDTEITLAVEDADDEHFELYDVYNICFKYGGKLNVTFKKMWSKYFGSYQVVTAQTGKYQSRKNLGGLLLKGVVTISIIPNGLTFREQLESIENTQLDSMNRINYHLFKIMQDMHNYTLFLYRSNKWGYTVNDTWVGAIGFMVRNEVDICVTSLRWSPERYGFYEATTNTYVASIRFIFRHPRSVNSGNIFLTPFVNIVWICVIIIGVAFSYLLSKLFSIENHKVVDIDEGNEVNLSNSLLMIFGILFQQGYSSQPMLTSARIVTISALVFSILLYQFYSSFIVGSLLTEAPKTIQTIQQLLDSKIECGMDDASYNRDIFNHASDRSAIKLYNEKILARNNIVNLRKGLELIKKGGFAFHADVSAIFTLLKNFLSDDEICDLQEISYQRPLVTGPAVPLRSPFKEMIKIDIRKLTESGILAYHRAIWEKKKPKCAKSTLDVAPIDIEHFLSAIYIVFIGITISLIVLIFEILFHRRHRRNLNEANIVQVKEKEAM